MPGTRPPFSIATWAVSPMTKISAWPGTVRSSPTLTRPALPPTSRRAAPAPRPGGVAPRPLGGRRHAGNQAAVLHRHVGRITDDEDIGMARHGQVVADPDPPCSVRLGAQPLGGGRGGHSGRPD